MTDIVEGLVLGPWGWKDTSVHDTDNSAVPGCASADNRGTFSEDEEV